MCPNREVFCKIKYPKHLMTTTAIKKLMDTKADQLLCPISQEKTSIFEVIIPFNERSCTEQQSKFKSNNRHRSVFGSRKLNENL